MDLRGLCSKIDLDSIRAKFPQRPAMPTMPQIKLPKSMPKLKSRKIFRTSREDVNKATPKQTPRPTSVSLQPIQQPAEFINHTPTRISTISSLMQQHTSTSTRRAGRGIESDESFERNDINTYRSAHSIEDDYPSATTLHGTLYADSPPIRSPVKRSEVAKPNSPQAIDSSNNVKMSLGDKLQKGYKDLTEFRFKNLLSKKTVVRSDNIEVDYYVQRYNEDRLAEEREQNRLDRKIAENYRFKFKETRQSSTRSYSMSPFDSPITQRNKSEQSLQRLSAGKTGKTVSEQSGDESGMETTPPRRGRKQLRLPRDHSGGSMSDDNELQLDEAPIQAPISSALWAIKEKQTEAEQSQVFTTVKKRHKERMRRLTSYVSSHEESGAESSNDAEQRKKQLKLQKFGRHSHVDEEPNATEKSEESLDEEKTTNKPMDAFKKNLKRFKSTMSIKRQPEGGANEANAGIGQKMERSATSPTLTRGEKLTARLRRFKTREVTSIENDETLPKTTTEPNSGSPLRTAIANKLQTWKMSFKRQPEETSNTGDEASPEKRTRSNTLKDKLKYIRSRKNPNSHEEREADNEGGGDDGTDTEQKKTSNLEEKFSNARQRTLKRVNEKMQKIKLFHKSQDNVDSENARKTARVGAKTKPANAIPNNDADSVQSSEMDDDIEEIPNRQDESYSYASTKEVHAVWTNKPILTDSTESEDNDADYPRVVIHQDESDLFESTLIIAVTTAAAAPTTPPSPTPKITEIMTKTTPKTTPTPRPKTLEWIAKKDSDASAGFSVSLSPNDDNVKTEWTAPTTRGHARKLSMDSNSDSDSWITETIRTKQNANVTSKEETRRTSAVGLNSIQENEEPWRVHAMYPEDKIYRAQSIDIFAENVKRGAFEDFDDELKNEPVLKIAIKSNSEDGSFGKDSSEDMADDDNSSRVTKIRVENISKESQVVCRAYSPEPVKISFEEQSRQIGNSRESLDANFDENEEYTDDEDDYDDDDDDEDRPPSAAPSPPPMSPPPPPLPQRQPSVRLTKTIAVSPEEMLLPLLPATRPPAALNKLPPKIPERTESMPRISKPLVKTSSLRLAYSEQVKPADVGKVNKLISRFEQPSNNEQQQTKLRARPRMRQRALMQDESEEYSDYEDKEEDEDEQDAGEVITDYSAKQKECSDNNINRLDITPTTLKNLEAIQASTIHDDGEEDIRRTTKKRIAPQPDESMLARVNPTTIKTISATSTQMPTFTISTNNANNNKTELLLGEALEGKFPKRNQNTGEHCLNIPKLTLTSSDMDNNANSQTQSKASSEYGSPLEYPSSLISSAETTPTPGRRQQKELRTQYTGGGQRRLRSMARDDDQYYSFDSDEENSYYSISSTGSSRYIVEI